ncbi:hypothetical protein K504DRAFT_486566 [Pleomassaria siparia CBS 279.74]|uniref:C2H2-type domain-containing protein n=1 Tax=Pleomassaria siparia CBS 279.74 TaxID=1314801 RepID=A0A6G1KPF6_9PLEO|nr:hypothetical protein K504DRAFT_486566 [Pleomassaria siparia CBS 279.74]
MPCRAVPNPGGPWTKPLDVNLHCTFYGETVIPFALYVKPIPTESSYSYSAFPQFCRLPVELQLRIIHFCDSSTLFQLMQTTSYIRSEAKKLFWSYPDAWYCVDGTWLQRGAFTGDVHHGTDLLTCVEQLNVDMESVRCEYWIKHHSSEFHENVADARAVALQEVDQGIRDFWRTVQRRCPRATRVVLSITVGDGGCRPTFSAFEFSAFEKSIVHMCPAGITVFVSLLQGALEAGATIWRGLIVLPPPKEFRGPVGWGQRYQYKWQLYYYQESAARILLNEAIERQHFHERHEPFNCFVPKCSARFNLPGEWAQHARHTGHDQGIAPPDTFKPLFDQHKRKMELLKEELQVAGLPIHRAWNLIKGHEREEISEDPILRYEPEDDEDQASIYYLESEVLFYRMKHDAELAFLYQIDHDPLYAQRKPARKSALWIQYQGGQCACGPYFEQ